MVVVESWMKSGSMISAGLALEPGREVFAVPGNINQPCSVGVNKLIADGDYPVMDLDTVTQVLGLDSPQRQIQREQSLSAEEKMLLEALRIFPGIGRDSLALSLGLEPRAASLF